MKSAPRLACFGSSIVSSYWNGAATYYRGIFRALARLGYEITFYEPNAYDRQKHRDIDDPPWASVAVYSGTDPNEALRALESARDADFLVKTSGVGVFDELLEAAVLAERRPGQCVIFWDVDAPATLDRVETSPADPFRALIPRFDLILTYGGGQNVIERYLALGASACIPIYNALDPDTHFRVAPDRRFVSDLSLLANRLPDRESRIDDFFLRAAAGLLGKKLLLGGSGWEDKPLPQGVEYVGHVGTRDHNAFNSSALSVLNVARDSMAKAGYSPATRLFEAAGAAACMITDAWSGIEAFFDPGKEILVANSGHEVAELVASLTAARAEKIGRAALGRALSQHTYDHRALELDSILSSKKAAQTGPPGAARQERTA